VKNLGCGGLFKWQELLRWRTILRVVIMH